jgi:hypothetical protein
MCRKRVFGEAHIRAATCGRGAGWTQHVDSDVNPALVLARPRLFRVSCAKRREWIQDLVRATVPCFTARTVEVRVLFLALSFQASN